MSLKAGPYPDAKAARTALAEAGYLPLPPKGRRPDKWIHPSKPYEFAVQILEGNRAKIVKYPDLRYLDYRVTSDAERAGQSFRFDTGSKPKRGAGLRPSVRAYRTRR